MNGTAGSESRRDRIMLGVWPVLWFCLTGLGGELHTKNEQGNQLFGQKQYDNAEKAYLSATREDPESPQLHYNIGNVLYMQQKYDKAMEEFSKALTTPDKNLRAKAYYNQGNALFKSVDLQRVKSQEEVQKAMEAYRKSIDSFTETLKIKPDDVDAKYNIEYIRRMLKELAQKSQDQQQQQQQQQSGQQQQQQQSGGDDKQKQEQQDQKNDKADNKDKKDKEDQEKQQPQPAEQKDQADDQNQQPDKGDKKQMTPEEARRILDSVKEDEKDKQRMIQIPDANYRGNDW